MQENARQGYSDTTVENEGPSLINDGLSRVDESCHGEGFGHCSGVQVERHVAMVVKEREDKKMMVDGARGCISTDPQAPYVPVLIIA